MNENLMIVYFSRPGNNYVSGKIVELPVGNTKLVAEKLAAMTGAKLLEVEPEKPYSADYQVCVQEATAELRNNARPRLKNLPEALDGYDTFVLAFPNWCGTMPMPLWTLLERYDFSGKTILPLCSNEGSGLGRSVRDMEALCPDAIVKPGLSVKGSAADNGALREWLERSGIAVTGEDAAL